MATTAIEWTDETLNLWSGCRKVDPACAHCYIPNTPPLRMAGRRFVKGNIPLVFHLERLEKPLRWRKNRMVFINSISDTFHEDVPDELLDRLFGTFAATWALGRRHVFQVLTKRIERADEYLNDPAAPGRIQAVASSLLPVAVAAAHSPVPWPLPCVWLGTTIGNRRYVYRADLLRETPAAVRFVSAEPLLGPLVRDEDDYTTPLVGARRWGDGYDGDELDLTDIDWLIVGGESGHGHRPMREEWVRDLRDACQEPVLTCCGLGYRFHGRCCEEPDNEGPRTAFFFKQVGGQTPKAGGRLLDGREWNEFPAAAGA